jgi:hypothetical protein
MGKEIVYCEICGDRILEQEFEKGRAITVLNKNYCFNCKDEAVKNITMEDVEDDDLDPGPEPAPPPARRPGGTRLLPRRGAGQTRKRPAPQPFPPEARQKHSKAPLLIGGGVGITAMVVLIVVIATSGDKTQPTNGGVKNHSNGANGSGPNHGISKAEKAWNELQEVIVTAGNKNDYDKIVATIRRIEPSVRGSKYVVQVARLKTEYLRKSDEARKSLVAEEAFALVKQSIADDGEFKRYDEILRKLADTQIKAPPGSMISAEIAKAKSEYTSNYEGIASGKYNEIIRKVKIHIDSEEFKPAMKIIDYYFPEVYRRSRIWKNSLEPLYKRCAEKLKKK